MQGIHRGRMGTALFAVALAAAGALLAAAIGGPAAGEAALSKTYRPIADSYVRSEYPNTNFGKELDLRTDGSPRAVSYLKFDLRNSGPITSAVLRVRSVKDSAGVGLSVARAGTKSWSETGITYANAPAVGTALDESGPMTEGQWVGLDVTPKVKGNEVLTLALTTTNEISRRVDSRESAYSPQLVVGVASTTTTPSTTTTTTTPTTTQPSSAQPAFPIRAAFYYPWFPEAWSQHGIFPYTKFTPTLGFYGITDLLTIQRHIRALQYGQVEAVISSWWGQGSKEDARFPLLLDQTIKAGSPLRWAPYYEEESLGDPTVAKLTNDLAYIKSRYASSPAYLRVGGRPVIFAFSTGSDACGMADRWKAANATQNFYVVLKVFSGYRNCTSQPASWHQYGPATASDRQAGYSFTISPGFNKADEATARLPRDIMRFRQNVRDMVASGEPWQLVTTFNEWGEGTAVESAAQWASLSGYGRYLDALHTNGN